MQHLLEGRRLLEGAAYFNEDNKGWMRRLLEGDNYLRAGAY